MMLKKITVENFKSFNQTFVFDLENTNAYEFNKSSVKTGIVNNALVYGHNGVGKSNLGLAIFDIIGHLTDKQTNSIEYSVYLNALNVNDNAFFKYEFFFEGVDVIYEYRKIDNKSLIFEKFIIDGKDLATIDRRLNNTAQINFKGTENLKTEIENVELSLLKYIKNNSVLDKNLESHVLMLFFQFIEGMLFFRSLQGNMFLGLEVEKANLMEDIIKRDNVEDFELFLNKAGIECKLKIIAENDKEALAFDFDGNYLSFFRVASQGTKSLILFYFWLQRIRELSKVSFLFIDEFDAFYHHELSILIIEELKKTGVQFVLTTHNTTIMTNDLLRPDCYFLMSKSIIKSLSKLTEKELREAHNIEKMYKAGAFNG